MRTETHAIQQAYRFALAPTVEQEELLSSFVGASRFWFNQGLALVKERLDARERGEAVRVPWSYHALCSEFRGDVIKDELAPWREEVVTGSYQAGLEALGRALQNFSAGRKAGRRVGFPCCRSKGRCHEAVIFQRPRIRNARCVEFDRRLGPIRVKERLSKLTRLLAEDEHARILRATVSRSGSTWYASFTVERSPIYPSSKTCSGCGAVKAKLSLSERVFTCDDPACGLVLDRDLNAAVNLARIAEQHAQAEGSQCYVAAAEAETLNARRGQVSPGPRPRLSPLKREDSLHTSEPPQRRKALAYA